MDWPQSEQEQFKYATYIHSDFLPYTVVPLWYSMHTGIHINDNNYYRLEKMLKGEMFSTAQLSEILGVFMDLAIKEADTQIIDNIIDYVVYNSYLYAQTDVCSNLM